MELINITGDVSRLDDVLYTCAASGCFHIESASSLMGESIQTHREDNPYAACYKKLLALDGAYHLDLSAYHSDGTAGFSIEDAENIVEQFENALSALSAERKALGESLALHKNTLNQIIHMKDVNVELHRMFTCKHVRVRFGRLPVDSYPKLKYYESEDFFFIHYDKDERYYWGMYFCTVRDHQFVDDVFDSLYFKRIRLPDFIHGTGRDAFAELKDNIAADKLKLAEIEEKIKSLIQGYSSKLKKIFPSLMVRYTSFELRSFAAIYNDRFMIMGFVPQKKSSRFVSFFDKIDGVVLDVMPPEIDHRLSPPVKLKNGIFSKPFEMFVEMYGLPSYNGFNPTLLVAVTYTLLFGIMFGDLGQGLVISLLGLLIYKKTGNVLGQIMVRVGISSAFFGFLFGSFFGFEHLLDPIYLKLGLEGKPMDIMENTLLILGAAIGIGIVIIFISILYNIIVSFRRRDYEKAVFGSNGVIGFVFYAALLGGAAAQLLLDKKIMTRPYVIFLLVLPLILMFFREPLSALMNRRKPHIESVGDFIASNFFEVFEFLLSYATNTLSFVRVGGFVLSHAGMMSVVMLLAQGASRNASPLVIVLGNLFVIGMEGLIVGIQVLRLEFYEIFSRCYEGGGQPYNPIRLNAD